MFGFVSKKKLRKWLVFCASNSDYMRHKGWTVEQRIDEEATMSVINFITSKAGIEQIKYKDIDEYNREIGE